MCQKFGLKRKTRAALALAVAFAALALPSAPPRSCSDPMQSVGVRPDLLKEVGIDQKLNQQVPLDLTFRDEHGQTVQLSQYFGQKPVISDAGLLQLPDAVHAGAERRGIGA